MVAAGLEPATYDVGVCLPVQGATQSGAPGTVIVNPELHIVNHTLHYGQASEAVQRDAAPLECRGTCEQEVMELARDR